MTWTREQRTAYQREWRARRRAESMARAIEPPPAEVLDPTNVGTVESQTLAELALMGSVTERMPGTCASVQMLARMMDSPGERSASVAAQLRLGLADLRTAAAGASQSGRLAALRGGVGNLRGAG